MARQCGEILAATHRIDAGRVPFLLRQDAAAHVEAHRQIVDRFGLQLPALDMALRWAAENVPARSAAYGRARRLSPRQPDRRRRTASAACSTGNSGRAAIRCRTSAGCASGRGASAGPRRSGDSARARIFIAAYERASGYSVDPAHVRFWEAFGNVKWVIHCLRLGMRGIAEIGIERCAIGRRIEEPLWDFLDLIEGRLNSY